MGKGHNPEVGKGHTLEVGKGHTLVMGKELARGPHGTRESPLTCLEQSAKIPRFSAENVTASERRFPAP